MNLERFLEDTKQVIADFDEASEKAGEVALYGSPLGADNFDIVYAGLDEAPRKIEINYAALSYNSTLLQEYANADSDKRSSLRDEQYIKLFSIVFALYRPGPAFRKGHVLRSDSLFSKVVPGGQSWREMICRPDVMQPEKTWNEALSAIGAIARQCPRLDKQNGIKVGSGMLMKSGALLTAGHVVGYPGWLFGNPPDPSASPGWVRYNCVAEAHAAADVQTSVPKQIGAEALSHDVAVVRQCDSWRDTFAGPNEFGSLQGLELQHTSLDISDLKNRIVAVVGHPVSGNAHGDPGDIPIVFGDAQLGTKRFMPGRLDANEPLVEENGYTLLKHDCSTLGGASGGCLLDLATGKVLGVHIAGNTVNGNRAVPAWVLLEKVKHELAY